MADTTQNAGAGLRVLGDWLKTPWALIAAIFLAMVALDPGNLANTAQFAVRALAHTAPYILFAVLLLAYLKATGAEVIVARAFEGHETRMIFLAAMFGGLAPFCSCEVIPFIAGFWHWARRCRQSWPSGCPRR